MNAPHTFTVSVDVCDGIWTAECDELGLVTEAASFEALTARAWEITPELAELNGLEVAPGSMRLRFEHVEDQPLQLAAS